MIFEACKNVFVIQLQIKPIY